MPLNAMEGKQKVMSRPLCVNGGRRDVKWRLECVGGRLEGIGNVKRQRESAIGRWGGVYSVKNS